MTILANRAVTSLGYPSGPVDSVPLKVARGQLTLVAGTAAETIPGYSANAEGYVSRRVAGGAIGDLTITYNAGTGALTVTSANAGDTSTVNYLLLE